MKPDMSRYGRAPLSRLEREQIEYLWRETYREMQWAAAQSEIAMAEKWQALLKEQEEALGYRPKTDD